MKYTMSDSEVRQALRTALINKIWAVEQAADEDEEFWFEVIDENGNEVMIESIKFFWEGGD